MSQPLHALGVADLGRALEAGTVSSVDITKHLLARVAAHEQLGAFLCTDAEPALRAIGPAWSRLEAKAIMP